MDTTAAPLLEDNNDEFNQDINLSDEETPSNFSKTSSNNVALNRKKFMDTAPSMMKLIQFGQHNSDNKIPTTMHDEHSDEEQIKHGHDAQGSAVEELLDSQMNNMNMDMDIALLAKQAAIEFQTLARQNDELYKEKESLKQKYSDQQQMIIELKKDISDMDSYTQQIETLKIENEKYMTDIMVLQQQIQLYDQQIQDLQMNNNNNTDDNNTENNDMNMNMQMEYDSDNVKVNNNNNNNINESVEYLQKEIKRLTQDNQQLLVEFDEYKIQTGHVNELEQKLKVSETEITRLSNALTEQQNNYIKMEKIKQTQIDKLSRQSTANADTLIVEYMNKEKEYIQTIDNLQHMVDQLNTKNQQLDEQRASLIQTKSDEKFNLSRLKTDVNLFGGDNNEYDDDPFGGGQMANPIPEDDESYENESDHSNIEIENENEKDLILKLQSELTTLKQQMSHIEESEQASVQKLLDLAIMGESNNNILQSQLENEEEEEYEYEYEEVEEEVEVEITDDEMDDEIEVVNVEILNKELHEKESELIDIKMERDQLKHERNDTIKQNENLLHHVEEMESMLENSFTEKQELDKQIKNMESSMNETTVDNATTQNDIFALEKRKEELENTVNEYTGQYEKLKAKQTHDRKRFEKEAKRAMMDKKEREKILEELQQQIMEYEELKKLSEEDQQRSDTLSLNMDMVNSLNITIAQLQNDMTAKSEQLKLEKNAHFETLDKFTKLQDQMDILNGDLSNARQSSADIMYRNENRIEQLETTIIELNNQIKEEHDKLKKSKSVIMSLRSENREFEEELVKMSDQMEEEHKQLAQQRRMSIQRMNDVVNILESNEESKHFKESQINHMKRENDEITEQLTNLAQNIAHNKRKWKENEKKYQKNIDKLQQEKQEIIELLEVERNVMESCMNAKMNTMTATNNEIEELRKVIKSQQSELNQLKNKGMFDDLWSWS